MRILQRLAPLTASFLLIKDSYGAVTGNSSRVKVTDECSNDVDCGTNAHCSVDGVCECNVNYIGDDCSIAYDLCDDTTVCYAGGTCVEDDTLNPVTQQFNYYCDCSKADAISASAGQKCNDSNFQNCISGQTLISYAYCINGGTCKEYIEDGDPSPGCDCVPGFNGQHCEYSTSQAAKSGGGFSALMKFYIVLIVFAGVLSLATLAIIIRRRIVRNKFHKESTGTTLKELQLEPVAAKEEAHGLKVEDVEIA